ncbi:MAG: PQQ-dependent sugar dehydrogenase, partial [Ktedonobacterales bacterium]|nr:PQQ-dependent sugar dehydrogenase [Ktedonobacterales bacterium]
MHKFPSDGAHRLTRVSRPVMVALLLAAATLVAAFAPTVRAAAPAIYAPTTGVPAGFVKTQLAHGLKKPTVIAFGPNGDIYLGMQGGAILIYRKGAVLPTPVVTLNTDGAGEKGLLGMVLDPNFATNGYLYVSYTTLDEHAILTRLTVKNDVASLVSEKVLLKGNQAQNPHHSANDLKLGPDGKLWWSVGDNVPSISNGRTLSNIYGKILRLNLDGTIPTDNPFLNVVGAMPAIYAFGLRNPFRFDFLPNGKAIEMDTGSSYWEEMNTIQRGGNFGWDIYEGNCGSCGSINPVYAYGHLPTDGAASAIAAYTGNVFPQQYSHVVFFGDYVRQDIEAVTFDASYRMELSDVVFDNSAGTIADLVEGPDGNLYYVSIFEGTFTKIAAKGPFAPTATAAASPSAGKGPLNVQFSSAGSTAAYGNTLTYSWN